MKLYKCAGHRITLKAEVEDRCDTADCVLVWITSACFETLGKTRDHLAMGLHQPRRQISVYGLVEHMT